MNSSSSKNSKVIGEGNSVSSEPTEENISDELESDEDSETEESDVEEHHPEQEQNLVPRHGPKVREFVEELSEYLRVRTESRSQNFTEAAELRRAAEQMETARLPISIWRTFMNVTLRFIAMFNISIDPSKFIEMFIQVLCIIATYFTENVLLQGILWAVASYGGPLVATIIIFIYHFLTRFGSRLWEYVKRKFAELYGFVISQVKSRSYAQFPHRD